MSERRTKFDKSQRSPERLDKRRSVESEVIEWPREPVPPRVIEENVRQRAYELYEARGRKGGDELNDWLQAEAEIRRRATGISNVIPFRPAPK